MGVGHAARRIGRGPRQGVPVLGTNSIIPQALRRLGRRIHGILGSEESHEDMALGHGHRAQVLAEHVSQVPGASLVWCSFDGEPLSAIVHANGHGTEVVGLFCPNCHSFAGTSDGVLGERRGGDAASVSV